VRLVVNTVSGFKTDHRTEFQQLKTKFRQELTPK